MTRKSVTDEQVGQLHRRTAEVVRRVSEGTISFGRTMYTLQRIIEGHHEPVIGVSFKVTVDYNQTLEQMVKACRSCGYDVDEGIAQGRFPGQVVKHFPEELQRAVEEKEVVLFYFNKKMTSKQVIGYMSNEGFRPVRIEELLALGAQHPEIPYEIPMIICLGSRDDHQNFPCMGREGSIFNYLDVTHEPYGDDGCEEKWYKYYRFAAVRK